MMQRLSILSSKRSRHGPIGLEISLEHMHLVQLCHGASNPRLHATASQPLSATFDDLLADTTRFKRQLREVLKQVKFAGRAVVTSMPSTATRVMSMNYEVKPGQSDGQSIVRLLHDRIGDELSDFVVDFMPIRGDERVAERAALIALCRKDTVNTYLDVLDSCGLQPQALEIGPVAIKRLVDVMQTRKPESSALVVNCGQEKSYLTLIANRQLLHDDQIDFGEQTILQRVADTLEVEPTLARKLLQNVQLDHERPDNNTRTLLEIIRPELNQLVNDIHRGLVYAASENRSDADTTIFLLGSIARWPGMDGLMSHILKHPVKTIPNPLYPFMSLSERERDGAEIRPELAIAAGLALRGVSHA